MTLRRALFLYNPKGGKGLSADNVSLIKQRLSKHFEVFDFVTTASQEDFLQRAKEASLNYDVLLLSGGDGTMHLALNAVGNEEKRPVLGLFPTGTCNDLAWNYRIHGTMNKLLDIVEQGKTSSFDVMLYNEKSFSTYAFGLGDLASIPYLTKRERKKKIGALAYYTDALPYFFSKKKISGYMIIDKKEKKEFHNVPFLLILNSKRVGSFTVNPKTDLQDGKMEVLYVEKGTIPAVASFALQSKDVKRIKCHDLLIHTDYQENWDVDGEKGPVGDLKVRILDRFLTVLVP